MNNSLLVFKIFTLFLFFSSNSLCKNNIYGTVTDIDGNIYKTVKIGEQWWMTENLRVTRYKDGSPIMHVTDGKEWGESSVGSYCSYNNDERIANKYGYLYNWFIVNDSNSVAPIGWHIPTDSDWKILEEHLGIDYSELDDQQSRGTNEGGMLKEVGVENWHEPNDGATNITDFSAVPGGFRGFGFGHFSIIGYCAFFWTSTEVWEHGAFSRALSYEKSTIHRSDSNKHNGFSIRLVKD